MELKKRGFQMPENINFEQSSLTDTYGKLIAGPFERGFGTTIGNSLRRILLSSIEGTAVTSIRIPGVYHELTTVQGVVEDVVDIILNIKGLRFKLFDDKPRVLKIKSKGPKKVTGKDIEEAQYIKVLTPDHHILTLDKDAHIEMDLTISKGRGYCPAEDNRNEDQFIDQLPIDSIFTPIKKINFWVEKARVGQATDYDRLIMEIWTDGSITPSKAVTQAANIMIDYLLLFSLDEEDSTNEDITSSHDNQHQEETFNPNLLKHVDELELSVRSSNCLKNANIETIAELVQKSENEMLKTKNFGRKSLVEIRGILEAMNLRFGMKIDNDYLEMMREKMKEEEDSAHEGRVLNEVSVVGEENAS